jgi:hypothetical protein
MKTTNAQMAPVNVRLFVDKIRGWSPQNQKGGVTAAFWFEARGTGFLGKAIMSDGMLYNHHETSGFIAEMPLEKYSDDGF